MARAILTATDFKELPIPQGVGAWYLGTSNDAKGSGFLNRGWEIADGTVSTNDPSYTKPNQTHGKYVKGGTTPNIDGGASSHYHNIGSHTHSMSGSTACFCGGYDGNRSSGCGHTHPLPNASGSLVAANNNPSRFLAVPMVYCKKPSTQRGLLTIKDLDQSCIDLFVGAIGWTELDTIPTGWALCDGSNGTPNLVGKFLKAVASGAGTTGGAADHMHYTEHNHGETSGASQAPYWGHGAINEYRLPYNYHRHQIYSAGFNSSSVVGSSEPLNRSIKFIMFVGYGAISGTIKPQDCEDAIWRIPPGIVVAKHTDGVPTNWSLCSQITGRLLGHAVTDHATDGSDTHTHSGDSHTHGSTGVAGAGGLTDAGAEDVWTYYPGDHYHDTYGPTWTNIQSVDSFPPYINMIFVSRS